MPGTPGRPEVKGDRSSGSAETSTSFPIRAGFTAKAYDGTDLGEVSENQRSEAKGTLDGRLYVEDGHPDFFHTFTTFSAVTTNASIISAPGTGSSLYLTDLVGTAEVNNGASTIKIQDGLTSTGERIRLRLGGDGTEHFSLKQPIKMTENSPVSVTIDGTTTSIMLVGFKAP